MRNLTMTQRYMHLSPAALDAAIGPLDRPSGESKSCGDILERRQIERSFGWQQRVSGLPFEKKGILPGAIGSVGLAVRQGFEPWVGL